MVTSSTGEFSVLIDIAKLVEDVSFTRPGVAEILIGAHMFIPGALLGTGTV